MKSATPAWLVNGGVFHCSTCAAYDVFVTYDAAQKFATTHSQIFINHLCSVRHSPVHLGDDTYIYFDGSIESGDAS